MKAALAIGVLTIGAVVLPLAASLGLASLFVHVMGQGCLP